MNDSKAFLLTVIISFVATFSFIYYYKNNNDNVNAADKFFAYPSNADFKQINSNSDATGRAPMQDSVSMSTHVKYRNAYYYEYDNGEYLDGLNSIFNVGAYTYNPSEWNTYKLGASGSVDLDPATTHVPPDVLIAYDNCINTFTQLLNRDHNNALLLPDTNFIPIQVVHDVLRTYGMHKTIKNYYLFDIEAILYRQSKYQGKHIGMRVTYNNDTNTLNVIQIGIIGVVAEDKIGMFPVVAQNPFDIDQLSATLTTYPEIIPAGDYSIVSNKTNSKFWEVTGYDKATIDTLQKRAALAITDIAASNQVGQGALSSAQIAANNAAAVNTTSHDSITSMA